MKKKENKPVIKSNRLYKKLCRKKTLFLLVITIISIPLNSFSQEKRITLKKEEAGLEDILKEIQKQTGLEINGRMQMP